MVGIGFFEALICLITFGMLLAAVGLLVALVVFAARGKASPAPVDLPRKATPRPAFSPADQDSHADVVARITLRFCPQCRSPLAPDAPEGLCPACLMAGAMGSQPPLPLGEGRGEGFEEPANGMAATTPPSGSKPPLVGEIGDLQQHFPHLEILELLGRGGMGAVYKARQKNLDRFIALKVIPPDAASDPAFAERFGREARALARLNHPSIVTVYDFGQTGETYWLLMEYVDGVNLRQTLRAGRLSPREALAIVPPICDALQYAHNQGVVHRDIKPENVLLDRSGRVKIADFGLAKLLGKGPDDFTLTRTQQVMGTPRYMAPEQIEKPTTVDHRADIYSLGVVIYEMLTGELPIGRFEPPSHKVELDVRIDQVVLRSLEKDPQRRYQRASEVKTDLASAASWPTAQAPAAAGNILPSPLAGEGPGVRGGPQSRPTWHTPAPANKNSGTSSQPPGGVPLGMVLAVAFGMVLGVLMMAGGVAAGIYAMTWGFHGFDGAFWGWMGGAFGCIVGGFGSASGSYNTYRQLAGAEDLMRSPRTTWFDWVMRGYLLVGVALAITGVIFAHNHRPDEVVYPLLLLGGIATFQALLFLILRALMRAPSRRPPAAAALDPRREAIRRRVAGPAIGLMIVGFMGLLSFVLALLAVPVLWPISSSVEIQNGAGDSPWDERALPAPLDTLEAPDAGQQSSLPIRGVGVLASSWPALAGMELPLLTAQQAAPQRLPNVTWIFAVGLVFLIALPLSLILILGGWQMRQLKSYGLAMVAAIVALLPCTIGWCLGLPMGIWALATLLSGDVRDAFDREQHDPGPATSIPPRAASVMPASPSVIRGRWSSPAVVAVAGIILVCGGILLALLLPAIQKAREAARRTHSNNNLHMIGLALHSYYDVHRSFPPAVVTDAKGKPLYSGRVLLLPFLDQQNLYQAFDLTQPWDSPRNRTLSRMPLPVFMDPSNAIGSKSRTDYLFVTGAGTMLEAGKNVQWKDVNDGTANTMMMVEVKGGGTSWAEPHELDVSQPVRLPEGNHGWGNLLLFADGSVRFVAKDLLGPSQVRALATRAGNEPYVGPRIE